MTENEVKNILQTISNPIEGKELNFSAALEGLNINGKEIKFRLVLPSLNAEQKKAVRGIVEGKFGALGYEVFASITERPLEELSKNSTPPPAQKTKSEFINPEAFKKFKKMIAVYSAKGGVGKSTISVSLALEFAKRGLKTALVDLDVYGPSVPCILGAKGEVKIYNDKFLPIEKNGVSMISVGNLVPDVESPLVWRAPIANGAVRQIFEDSYWQETFDICVIDMPPGTGDIPITVGQNIPLEGILAVSTPQSVALEDTIKGIVMFSKLDIPIIGLVKNMCSISCPSCQKAVPLYPKSEEFDGFLAKQGIPVLGELPLDPTVASFADQGTLNLVDQKSIWAQEFSKLTDALSLKVGL